jgi:hypothetical protein
MRSFLTYFQKNESRLVKSAVCLSICLSVCPQLVTFELLCRFHGILYIVNAIQGDLDAIIFNPIASIILKLLRPKVVR